MRIATRYIGEMLTIGGRLTKVDADCTDYLTASELAATIDAAIKLSGDERKTFLKQRGIARLSLAFAAAEEE